MAKTYSIQEVQQKLAKHIEGMIERVADDIQDLAKREQIKKSLWATAHEEPGQHEAQEPGVAPHMEPGGHEHFEMNPTAGPEAATAEPIQGGNGVPPGQLADPNHQMVSMVMGDGPCPLCQQPEQSCHCLDSMVLGKDEMGMGGGAAGALSMSEQDGRNKDPSKKQPSKPVDGAKMPPEAPKQIKSVDGAKPKENSPLNKVGVPEAKPPSGKVPGGTSAPPMASTTSKPGVTKEEPLDKAVMQAAPPGGAPKPGGQSMTSQMKGGGATGLTHPSNTSVAAGHAAAMGGAFQPKGPISSGLELAPKAGVPGAAGAKPPAPVGLKPPAPAARGAAPGGMPSMPKPGAAMAPKIGAKPGIFGGLFGKSEAENCALCGKSEHMGDCK